MATIRKTKQELSIANLQFYRGCLIKPKVGNIVYSVIPPFKITSISHVLKDPSECFTAGNLFSEDMEREYTENAFPRLIKEEKIKAIGQVGRNGKISVSTEGKKFFEAMVLKYEW